MHFKVLSLLVVAIYSLYKKHNLYTSIRALNITALSKYSLLKQDLFEFCFQKNAAATILFIDIYIQIWILGQEATLINRSPALFYNSEENHYFYFKTANFFAQAQKVAVLRMAMVLWRIWKHYHMFWVFNTASV